ncbi:hypothetical protein G4B88_022429 [Cannabis sativa]|uniref:CN hydrolase domain-containing protein n=1 Tax=Cannabis sativa TaxID=3483 RepID=A0A7J6HVV3_CANSA|nr:hypothetical protein G4B88_022429 [Cannabis sativa]
MHAELGRIGIGICHDIRFPELAMLYREKADNQSPARASSCSYMIWGHSTLVGPSGEIIATSGDQETVVVGEIDYSKIQQQRKSLPLNEHKRREIYQCVDVHEQEQDTD